MTMAIKKVLSTGLLVVLMSVIGFGQVFSYGGTFDAIAHMKIVKATIKSFDTTKVIKKNLVKRVNNIIELLKDDRDDKAVLKAKRIKADLEKRLAKPNNEHFKHLSTADTMTLLDLINEFLDNM